MLDEPTILVKKADGTTARMPLSQLQKNKTAPLAAATTAASRATVALEQAPKKLAAQAALNTLVTQDEFSDPFEPLESDVTNESVVPASREAEVEKIIAKLSFKVASTVENRLRSLVLSKLKDVRTIDQLKIIAMRLVTDGGLGLQPSEAAELANACLESELPAKLVGLPPANIADGGAVALSAPNTGFVYSKSKATFKPALSSTTPVKPPETMVNQERHATILTGAESRMPKRVMQDVLPAAPEEIGPIDEIRMVTLRDFRRLSQNPLEAAARFGQKFVAIKEENILLYLAALAAWKQSPLFKEYISAITKGINNQKRIDTVADEESGIQVSEIQAIVTMEKTFTV